MYNTPTRPIQCHLPYLSHPRLLLASTRLASPHLTSPSAPPTVTKTTQTSGRAAAHRARSRYAPTAAAPMSGGPHRILDRTPASDATPRPWRARRGRLACRRCRRPRSGAGRKRWMRGQIRCRRQTRWRWRRWWWSGGGDRGREWRGGRTNRRG